MYKKLIMLVCIMTMVSLMTVGASAASKISIYINGLISNGNVLVIKGVTYLPLREMSGLLGIPIRYDKETNSVYVASTSAIVEPRAIQYQTYENNVKGIKFEYPSTWYVEESDQDTLLFLSMNKAASETDGPLLILVSKSPKDSQWLRLFLDGFSNKITQQKVKFGSMEATKIETLDANGTLIHYGLENNNRSILLSVFQGSPVDNYEINRVLDSLTIR